MGHRLFNVSDYAILEVFIHYDCTSPIAAFTREQLIDKTGFSLSKVRNSLSMFLMLNMIKEGAKDGKKKTYYITDEGIDNFQEAYRLTDEELDLEFGKDLND
ncbi:hypothetical protein ACV3Q3_13080 [Clostridium perfringens]|uniref:Uncharacterized protein n=1 Tax=Clostridium perfringens TaxID=1502 RepID=A0AAP6WS07_CLOPF|nr:hypothetical protein [Clostridium perfringens]EGT3619236.1 hypothetical protein [Clostridium perfringens]NGU31069.1 hypothetical protein [Clostridium perfringens]